MTWAACVAGREVRRQMCDVFALTDPVLRTSTSAHRHERRAALPRKQAMEVRRDRHPRMAGTYIQPLSGADFMSNGEPYAIQQKAASPGCDARIKIDEDMRGFSRTGFISSGVETERVFTLRLPFLSGMDMPTEHQLGASTPHWRKRGEKVVTAKVDRLASIVGASQAALARWRVV